MKKLKKLIYIAFFAAIYLCFISSCGNDNVFERIPAEDTGINFNNRIESSDSLNVYDYVYFYNGGGVAITDINNDGLKDVFFTGNLVSSRLYLNKGDWKFEDITKSAGIKTTQWTTGVAVADINNDGYKDLYVSSAGSPDPEYRKNRLFINNGDTTFTEMAKAYSIADTSHTTQAAFFDYDQDGDLDVYLLNHAHEIRDLNSPMPIDNTGKDPSTDKLYRNNGNGTFTNVSERTGITNEGYGLGVAISDINNDGWPDIYAANDFISNDIMYINNGDGTFSNKISDYLDHQSWSGMGSEIADYNNDGLVDIFVLDMLPESNLRQKMMSTNPDYEQYQYAKSVGYEVQYMRNTLQLNIGNGTFSEIGQLAAVDKTDWSWSSLMADFDNDGFKDLIVTNGYLKDMTFLDFITRRRRLMMFQDQSKAEETLLKELESRKGIKPVNKIFRNQGDLTFSDVTKRWGFKKPSFSNGAAYGDLDNDGDLDLVTNNINEEAFLYKNQTSEADVRNNYLNINLIGEEPNTEGIGAKVSIYINGKHQFIEKNHSRGYQSSVTDVLHFGVGKEKLIDSVKVVWPGNRYQILRKIKANQTLEIKYSEASSSYEYTYNDTTKPQIFDSNTAITGLEFLHQENSYNDFKENPMLPQMYSRAGPGIAIGDVDQNGLDDIYIGGAANYPGSLFLQLKEGQFRQKEFSFGKKFEDMGALFFDADQDGDLDLYIVSGGSSAKRLSLFQDRLYLNNGKGNFTEATEWLPDITSSGSCVTAADYDRDGDLDLFVGGRIQPGNYPYPPRSFLFENQGDKFVDVTLEKATALENPGMVNSAIWTDFNNDTWIDLIVVGEWMPISVYQNVGGSLKEVTEELGLEESQGWWNSIISGDFDADGDTDYVAGNLGLNTLFKGSPEKPVQVFANDFDGDKTKEFILSRFIQDHSYPVYPRDVMVQKLPHLKWRFTHYEQYANAKTKDLFSKEKYDDAYSVKAVHMETSFIENIGSDGFHLFPLPIRAQFSPVYGMASEDFDSDGNLDLLMIGNNYQANSITGRYDAGTGLYLKGNGNGKFEAVNTTESGFFTEGDTRSLSIINHSGKPLVLATVNQDSLRKFSVLSSKVGDTLSHNILEIQPDDASAVITYKNGETRKQEFGYGSGYLSQSSRWLTVSDSTLTVEIVNFLGEKRKINTRK